MTKLKLSIVANVEKIFFVVLRQRRGAASDTSRTLLWDDLFLLEYSEIFFVKVRQRRGAASGTSRNLVRGVFLLDYRRFFVKKRVKQPNKTYFVQNVYCIFPKYVIK